MRHLIRPDDVRVGMYIQGFGGSWYSHPFWRAKFVVRTKRQLERVQASGVTHVVIDDELGLGISEAASETSPALALPAIGSAPLRIEKRRLSPAHPGWRESENDPEKSEWKQGRALVARSFKVLRRCFTDVRLGRAVRLEEVSEIVQDVIGSVERNPRTLLDILRLKTKDEYTYMHSVAVCTLMVNAARHMGKTEAETRDYGLAGLLHDLGKMGIPDTILNKAGRLTDAEFIEVKDHPERGYQILNQSPNVPEMALDVCRHHHEKMDGSGYPFGLSSEAISMVARLGAVCDVYDALTSERVYKDASSPVDALAAMWNWEGHFDRALLFTFMQSIGVFPPGMLVQLRTNRLGLVLENHRRNSRTRVLAFYATRERTFIEPEEIVIQDNLANDSIVATAQPEDWGIANWDDLRSRLTQGERPPLAA